MKSNKATASITKTTIQLTHLLTQWNDGKLDTRPGYQRRFVWTQQMSSMLIESILLPDRYIPPVLFNRAHTAGGGFLDYIDSVIDGQQRLRTVLSYIGGWSPFKPDGLDGKSTNQRLVKTPWALSGLLQMPELNGKTYAQLDATSKEILQAFAFEVVVVTNSDKRVLTDIFMRLNKGTRAMSPHELRNALYSGPANTLLIKLSSEKKFLETIRLTNDKRMHGVGLVLRWLAFFRNGADGYVKKFFGSRNALRDFLYAEMDFQDATTTAGNRLEITKRFLHGLELSRRVFGSAAFTMGDTELGAISIMAFEMVMVGFSLYSAESILENKDVLRERFFGMSKSDGAFQFGVDRGAPMGVPQVLARYKAWGQILDEVLGAKSLMKPMSFGSPTTLTPMVTAEEIAEQKKELQREERKAAKAALPPAVKKLKVKPLKVPAEVLLAASLPVEVPAELPEEPFEDVADAYANAAAEEASPVALPATDSQDIGEIIYETLMGWNVEDRKCVTCGGSINDKQMKSITFVPKEGGDPTNDWDVSHSADDCLGFSPLTQDTPGASASIQ